jgi:feruloyl-CoA synthase
MIFLGPAATHQFTDVPVERLAEHPGLRALLHAALARHNTEHGANSERVARFIVLREPPSIDAGEITDKGYINQRAVLARRADLVERLHAREESPDVVVLLS